MAKIIDAILRLTDNFSPVISKATEGISNFSRQALSAGRDIQKVGGNIESMGKTMTLGLTAPLTALGASSVKTVMDFDSSLSKVQAISGATVGELEKLRDKAIEVGADTAWSASNVGEAMQYMALAGWKTEDMLQGVRGVMDAASASGEDLAMVSDIITDGLSAFGLSAGESTRFADVLASTAANANTTIGMMGEAFTYVGSVAGSLGYSVEDTSIAIGLMANSGIKASQAGTTLRKIMTEMQGTVKVTGKELGTYSIQMSNADGTMKPFRETLVSLRHAFSQLTEAEKAQQAEAIAGKTGMAGLLSIVNASEKDFNKLAGAIDNSNGKATEMADVMLDNLSGQITLIKSGIESLAISIGDRFTPYLSKVADVVQKVVTYFNSLDDAQKDQLVRWGLITASIGPAVFIFGKIVTTVGKIVTSFGKFGKAIKDVKSIKDIFSVVLTPGNVVVLVLMGVIYATTLLIKHWDKLSPYFKKIWGVLKKELQDVQKAFDKVTKFLMRQWEDVEKLFKKVWDKLKPHIQALWPVVKQVINDVIAKWQEAKRAIYEFCVEAAQEFEEFKDGLVKGIRETIQWFKDFKKWCNENEQVLGLLGIAIGTVTALVLAYNRAKLASIIISNAETIALMAMYAWDFLVAKSKAIVTAAVTAWNSVCTTATTVTGAFSSALAFLISPIGLVILAIGAVIGVGYLLIKNWENVKEQASKLGSYISGTFTFIKDTIIGTFTNAFDTIKQAWNDFKAIFTGESVSVNASVNQSVNQTENAKKNLTPVQQNWVAVGAYANGTDYFQGGLAQINEKGGEIVELPRATRIIPHDESLKMAKKQGERNASSGGGINITVQNLNVREDADIDKIANALLNKIRKQQLNMA